MTEEEIRQAAQAKVDENASYRRLKANEAEQGAATEEMSPEDKMNAYYEDQAKKPSYPGRYTMERYMGWVVGISALVLGWMAIRKKGRANMGREMVATGAVHSPFGQVFI